jgi:signal transduction histidine kinase
VCLVLSFVLSFLTGEHFLLEGLLLSGFALSSHPTTKKIPERPIKDTPLQPLPGHFHILLIAPDPACRAKIEAYFQPWGYPVSYAAKEEEALEILSQEASIDLVLLDSATEEFRGFACLEVIRKLRPLRECSIILMLSDDGADNLSACFEAGADDYIVKPLSRAAVLSRVKTQLRLIEANRNLEMKVLERTLEYEQRGHEILRRQNQLIMQEKMTSLGTLTAGVAHEIKNPLNFITNLAHLSKNLFATLAGQIEPHRDSIPAEAFAEIEESLSDLRKNITIIADHGYRANQIIQSMNDIIAGKSAKTEPTNLNGLVEKFVQIGHQRMRTRESKLGISLTTNYDKLIGDIDVDSASIGRVLINVLNNALEAVAARAEITPDFQPHIHVATRFLGEEIEIRIRDNGNGIDPEHIGRIFDPFYTTKTGEGHLGLGLYISYDIVTHEHKGRMKLDSQSGGPTECIITIPAHA